MYCGVWPLNAGHLYTLFLVVQTKGPARASNLLMHKDWENMLPLFYFECILRLKRMARSVWSRVVGSDMNSVAPGRKTLTF